MRVFKAAKSLFLKRPGFQGEPWGRFRQNGAWPTRLPRAGRALPSHGLVLAPRSIQAASRRLSTCWRPGEAGPPTSTKVQTPAFLVGEEVRATARRGGQEGRGGGRTAPARRGRQGPPRTAERRSPPWSPRPPSLQVLVLGEQVVENPQGGLEVQIHHICRAKQSACRRGWARSRGPGTVARGRAGRGPGPSRSRHPGCSGQRWPQTRGSGGVPRPCAAG